MKADFNREYARDIHHKSHYIHYFHNVITSSGKKSVEGARLGADLMSYKIHTHTLSIDTIHYSVAVPTWKPGITSRAKSELRRLSPSTQFIYPLTSHTNGHMHSHTLDG